ncbi:hypothetical protein Q3G72_023078 [Acer saccharum]|nr:hypothetical protein Q3G72_023078 [Acer saccharum]
MGRKRIDRFSVLFGKIVSCEFSDFFQRQKLEDHEALLKKLKKNMIVIDAVLAINNFEPVIKSGDQIWWLNVLNGIILGLEDLLHDVSELEAKLKIIASPTTPNNGPSECIEEKMKEIIKEMDYFATIMGKQVSWTREPYQLSATDRFEDIFEVLRREEDIVEVLGREEDKKAVLNLLLSHNNDDQIGIITIVGERGVGKSTLAQLVYNDHKVEELFDIKKWIYISENCDSSRWDQIIESLFEWKFSLKKFLVILDDVRCGQEFILRYLQQHRHRVHWPNGTQLVSQDERCDQANQDKGGTHLNKMPAETSVGPRQRYKLHPISLCLTVAAYFKQGLSHIYWHLATPTSFKSFHISDEGFGSYPSYANGFGSQHLSSSRSFESKLSSAKGFESDLSSSGGFGSYPSSDIAATQDNLKSRKDGDVLKKEEDVLRRVNDELCEVYWKIILDYLFSGDISGRLDGDEDEKKKDLEEPSIKFYKVLSFPAFNFVMLQLCIEICPKLKRSLPRCLPPSIENFEISECPCLEARFPTLPSEDFFWLHDGNRMLLRRFDKQPPAPGLPDSNVVKLKSDDEMVSELSSTDVSITSLSSPPETSKISNEDSSIKHVGASEIPLTESSSDTDDLINIWYSQISSLESLKVSEISQLLKLPPRLHTLKIEGCDALKSLPKEQILHNIHLQQLYIIDCCFLESFSVDHLPTTLKSLYIRNCRKLKFPSPSEKKQHALLEHLCIGSSCDSLSSFHLSLFPGLRSLAIWDCVNFSSISISENHKSLDALEIRDCPELLSFLVEEGFHTPNLTSIFLSNCKNLKGIPKLISLRSFFINGCPELSSIIHGCFPENLSSLCITYCHKLTPSIQWKMNELNNLSCFEIEGGCIDLKSFPEQNLLPSSLNSLRISRLSNLEFLDYKGLECLTSLETREDAHLTFFFEHHWMLVAVTALSTEPGEDWPKISQFANKKLMMFMSDQLSISKCFSSSIVSYLIVQSLNHFQMSGVDRTKGRIAQDFSSCLQVKQDNMAGGIMAGGSLLSAYLQGLLDKLTSGEFVEFFLRGHKLVPLVRNLVETILTVNTMLDDADEKQFKNPAIRRWHNELIEVGCRRWQRA